MLWPWVMMSWPWMLAGATTYGSMMALKVPPIVVPGAQRCLPHRVVRCPTCATAP
jgi:hypothetical protein